MIACDVLGIGTVGLMAIPGMPFPALRALLFCTVLAGAPLSSARAALLPDVLPGDMFVLGSAVGDISFQASRILGFVAGAAVVAVVDPYQTLGLDAVSFGISALIVAAGSRPRPLLVLRPADRKRGGPAAAVRLAAVEPGRRGRRVPVRRRRGLRAGPAARDQGRGVRPGAIRPVRRPGARHPGRRAVAQAIGAPLAVGLIGLTAATMLAVSWTQLHGYLPRPSRPGPRGPRTAAC